MKRNTLILIIFLISQTGCLSTEKIIDLKIQTFLNLIKNNKLSNAYKFINNEHVNDESYKEFVMEDFQNIRKCLLINPKESSYKYELTNGFNNNIKIATVNLKDQELEKILQITLIKYNSDYLISDYTFDSVRSYEKGSKKLSE